MRGKQRCEWHWLLAQSAEVQAFHANERLAQYREAGFPDRPRRPAREWPAGERWCAGCQSFVPLFYCRGSRCRACASVAAHGARIEKTYGLSPEDYQKLLEKQGGRCAICRNKSRTIRLPVDHDHRTGEVRGLLCTRCNHDLLGGAHDSVDLLFRAIGYLLFPPAQDGPPATPRRVLGALDMHLQTRALRDLQKPSDEDPAPF